VQIRSPSYFSCAFHWDSKHAGQAVTPSPVRQDNSKIFTPGFNLLTACRIASRSKSDMGRRSILFRTTAWTEVKIQDTYRVCVPSATLEMATRIFSPSRNSRTDEIADVSIRRMSRLDRGEPSCF